MSIPQSLETKITEIDNRLQNNSLQGVYSRLMWLGRHQKSTLTHHNISPYVSRLEDIESHIDMLPSETEMKVESASLANKLLAHASILPLFGKNHKKDLFTLDPKMDLKQKETVLNGLYYFNKSLEENESQGHKIITYLDQERLLLKILPKNQRELEQALEELSENGLKNELFQGLSLQKLLIDNFSSVRTNQKALQIVKRLRPRFRFSVGTVNAVQNINQYTASVLKILSDPQEIREVVNLEYDVLQTARDILNISSHENGNGVINELELPTYHVARFLYQEAQIIKHVKNQRISSKDSSDLHKEYVNAVHNFRKVYRSLNVEQRKTPVLKKFYDRTKVLTQRYQNS